MMTSETIFALSSAAGKAGVSVVRVSGQKAWNTLEILMPHKELPKPYSAKLCKLINPKDSSVLDHALVVGFKAPASFTGEDVIEYHVHGSIAVIDELLEVLSQMEGCRLAEPGEFTRRAFENSKMDLTEAEAVADLIEAETAAQKNQALAQMGGALADLYHGWAEELTKALAYVEAIIDFPDEDVPDSETAKALPAIEKIVAAIDEHLNDNRRGEMLRSGVQVAIIGAPNAGKSSLVNALAQRDVAIVSDMAGTTRDIIEVHLNLGGYPVILADTAGLRPDQLGSNDHDTIESEGIKRALQRAEGADIRLLVFDGSADKLDQHTLELVDDKSLVLINKSDVSREKNSGAINGQIPLNISVTTGEGIGEFLNALTTRIEALMKTRSGHDAPTLTRRRHRSALEEAHEFLKLAIAQQAPDLMAEELRAALRSIGRITGRVDVEDLLDVIFRDFCIGK
ncbi:MAG: tRNA uridine-5-carboxymethylaminomethyl(34) synthesis GTPase MnmE [Alphaproteobacteria bacterium]|nr:tRNA uridine-5-carboxymethylaminomethyl(34) synthesis GTPase MnmE [Alphaproteobacteria bacterium]